MTYRASDIENKFNTEAETTAPVRHLRRRRRMAAMSYRSGGMSFNGLGI